MTVNTPLKTAIAFLLFVSTSSMTKAATDSTDITLSYTYAPYVSLTGTAPGASRFYDNSEITNSGAPLPVNIGTMGLESNVGGACDLIFSTANGFKLKHTITGNNLGNYKILYKGVEFNETSNPQLQLPSCTSAATDIDFELNAFSLSSIDFFLDSGIYRDVITVIVTTQ